MYIFIYTYYLFYIIELFIPYDAFTNIVLP